MKRFFLFCFFFLLSLSFVYAFGGNVPAESVEVHEIKENEELNSQLNYKYNLSKAKLKIIDIENDILDAKKNSDIGLVNTLLSQKKVLESEIELLQTAIDATEKEETTSLFLGYIIWGFLGIFLISVLSLLTYALFLRLQLKESQKQQETFLQILEKASFVQELDKNEEEDSSEIQNGENFDLKSLKSELAKLKKKQLDDTEFVDLKNLSIQCEMIGRKVDKATGRKNNSKNVADLVFKLSHELACTSYEALIYYCAALVFDVGFLYINQKIFSKIEINENEKAQIRSHVHKGKNELVFIPQKYRPVFEVAVSLHHENNDGSGYPNGLTKKDIPLLARMIRVAETYTALITRRNYRAIFDRDAAFLVLKKESAKYDKDVLAALYRIM